MNWHLSAIRRHFLSVRFLTLHYAYFIVVCLVCSLVFWGASTPFGSVHYIDALFLTVSAMTEAGLNTINLSALNTFQQIMLFFLIMIGSGIWISIAVVLVRRHAFEKRFGDIVGEERLRRRGTLSSLSLARGRFPTRSTTIHNHPSTPQLGSPTEQQFPWHTPRYGPGPNASAPSPRSSTSRRVSEDGNGNSGCAPEAPQNESREDQEEAPTDERFGISVSTKPPGRDGNSSDEEDADQRSRENRVVFVPGVLDRVRSTSVQPQRLRPPYTNVRARVPFVSRERQEKPDSHDRYWQLLRKRGRNSTFHDLSEAERKKVGGAEYRAVCLLSIIVPAYFFLWQSIGGIVIAAYVARNRASVTERNGLNPWWSGFFFAISAFNNSGMSLVDANMVAFQNCKYMLVTMGLLILAGNTCYPVFLRLILWTMRRLLPDKESFSDDRETLQFLLDHPRRCYTYLFPSRHTWWLLCSVIVLNGIDWFMFELLDLNNPIVTSVPPGLRTLIGLFQALCVRSGGFYVVDIADLQLGMQVIYVVMMYISVYPVVITLRNSNVYEERSLGIYADDRTPNTADDGANSSSSSSNDDDDDKSKQLPGISPSGRLYFITQQLRAQLAHDTWWIALAVIIICIVEADSFKRNPVTFSAFNIIFETVSAYGCVGISTGLPNQLYSFSGAWHSLSKLVLCAVMLRGRHRGLPVAIDKAILLPGDYLARAEEEDATIRLERTMSRSRSRGVV